MGREELAHVNKLGRPTGGVEFIRPGEAGTRLRCTSSVPVQTVSARTPYSKRYQTLFSTDAFQLYISSLATFSAARSEFRYKIDDE